MSRYGVPPSSPKVKLENSWSNPSSVFWSRLKVSVMSLSVWARSLRISSICATASRKSEALANCSDNPREPIRAMIRSSISASKSSMESSSSVIEALVSSGEADQEVAIVPSSSFTLLNSTVTPVVLPLMPAYRWSSQLPDVAGVVKCRTCRP